MWWCITPARQRPVIGRMQLPYLMKLRCRMSYVLGGVKISKVKKAASRRKYGESGFFWRHAFDPVLHQVVTDRSAADFIA
jgi:hypothetical protein